MRKLFLTTALLSCPSVALAHPHQWVSMHSDLVFNADGKVEGVDVEWTFDDAYAKLALEGMDTNGDGQYSQDELAPLTKENLDALRDYNYFTYFHTANKKLEIGAPKRAGQTYNGKLHLHFEVPLKEPYDPRQGALTLQIYDPEFFISFDYIKDDPVGQEGDVPKGCEMVLKPVPSDKDIAATQAMLATKPADWKPENGEDFGSLFAQALVVSCK
ncbi:MAG: DUF1007 family protein [Alphaproteobacteria bacterium]|nr:DUF1007 family protein [Alphaproteobacteria bacterium]